MAWVKLDDQAPRNGKMLKAGPAACWLWVCGIAHCQSQLTDGFVSFEALPMIGIAGTARVKRLAETLVGAKLFDRADGGYQVHDYLDHNPSKASVIEKRAEDADRKRTAESGRIPKGIQADSGGPRAGVPSHPIPSHPIPTEKRRGGPPMALGLKRFKVWRWMLDDLLDSLGEHAEAFDVDQWLRDLDASETRVIAESWPWLKQEMLSEARRRGLPMALAEVPRKAGRLTEDAASMDAGVVEILKRQGVFK